MRTGVAIQTSNYDWDNVLFKVNLLHNIIMLLNWLQSVKDDF